MSSPRSSTVDRRTALTGLAAGIGSLGLAGCLDAITGDGDEATTESDDDASAGENDDSSTESDDGSSTTEDDDSSTAEDDDSSTENDDDASTEIHAEYESTDVRATTPDGDELGEVTAAIADTPELQRLGLSDTEELPEDRGMLFVYDEVDDRVFGMPDMSFGIDIIYADDEGVITEIHHAEEPGPDEDGTEQTYPGRGQYVLEVVYEWTDEHDVEEGDILEFDL